MTVYVDYIYYAGTYLGTAIASSEFPSLAIRASAYIDRITFGRTAPVVLDGTDTATIDLIKMATCAVAEQVQEEDEGGGIDGVQSESVGSSSVTYNPKSDAQRTASMRITQAATLFLASTGLMFKGFAEGEYADQYRHHSI